MILIPIVRYDKSSQINIILIDFKA